MTTILFSFACRGIQDAHADRNNVPVSHTSRHGIWGPKLLPIILTGVAARAHHAPNVFPNMRRNMYLYATRRNPAWWGDMPRNRWNHAVFGLITRNPAGGTHGVLRMRRDSNSRRVSPSHAFEACSFDRSDTHPHCTRQLVYYTTKGESRKSMLCRVAKPTVRAPKR